MITPQERINQLEAERQRLYGLGNGLDVDGERRKEQLLSIEAQLAAVWSQERARRAGKRKDTDAAWGQAR